VAIAHGPDAWNAGTQLIVDLDVALCIEFEPGFLHAEIIGVGASAHCQEHVGSNALLGLSDRAIDTRCNILTASFEAYALGFGADRDSLIGENPFDGAADVCILP